MGKELHIDYKAMLVVEFGKVFRNILLVKISTWLMEESDMLDGVYSLLSSFMLIQLCLEKFICVLCYVIFRLGKLILLSN